MRTIERLAILAVVGTIGAVATTLLYIQTANSESKIGRTSFEGDFKSQVFELQSFFASKQLLGLRAVADALSSYGKLPSFEEFARVSYDFRQETCEGFAAVGRRRAFLQAVGPWCQSSSFTGRS
jgi:hypothetical protein